jgi:hypothetical protein
MYAKRLARYTYTADDAMRANRGYVRRTPCIDKHWFQTRCKQSASSARTAANERGRRQSCTLTIPRTKVSAQPHTAAHRPTAVSKSEPAMHNPLN